MPLLLTIRGARAVGNDVDQSFGPRGVLKQVAVYEDRRERSVTVIYSVDSRIERYLPRGAKDVTSLAAEVLIALSTECPFDRVSVGWSDE